MSHLGKVKTEEDKAKNDLRCVAERLAELVDTKVSFCPVTRGEELENMVADLKDGEIVLMQNTRYEKGESKTIRNWHSTGQVLVKYSLKMHSVLFTVHMLLQRASQASSKKTVWASW